MFGFIKLSLRPVMATMSKVNVMPQFVNNFINSSSLNLFGLHNMQSVRLLNRNARRPKRANHGKRPVSHARRWAKRGKLTSVAYRTKTFGFW